MLVREKNIVGGGKEKVGSHDAREGEPRKSKTGRSPGAREREREGSKVRGDRESRDTAAAERPIRDGRGAACV